MLCRSVWGLGNNSSRNIRLYRWRATAGLDLCMDSILFENKRLFSTVPALKHKPSLLVTLHPGYVVVVVWIFFSNTQFGSTTCSVQCWMCALFTRHIKSSISADQVRWFPSRSTDIRSWTSPWRRKSLSRTVWVLMIFALNGVVYICVCVCVLMYTTMIMSWCLSASNCCVVVVDDLCLCVCLFVCRTMRGVIRRFPSPTMWKRAVRRQTHRSSNCSRSWARALSARWGNAYWSLNTVLVAKIRWRWISSWQLACNNSRGVPCNQMPTCPLRCFSSGRSWVQMLVSYMQWKYWKRHRWKVTHSPHVLLPALNLSLIKRINRPQWSAYVVHIS